MMEILKGTWLSNQDGSGKIVWRLDGVDYFLQADEKPERLYHFPPPLQRTVKKFQMPDHFPRDFCCPVGKTRVEKESEL